MKQDMLFVADAPFVFTVKGGQSWPLTAQALAELKGWYPALDVDQECRSAQAWLAVNPERRKTYNAMLRFLVNWMKRALTNHPQRVTATVPQLSAKVREQAQQVRRAWGFCRHDPVCPNSHACIDKIAHRIAGMPS